MEKNNNSRRCGAKKYPGVAIDVADNEKVDSKLVKERVKVENNNPRNND